MLLRVNTPTQNVYVTDFVADALEPEYRILCGIARVQALNAFTEDDLVGRIEDADAVMTYHTLALTRKTIERLHRCKLIVRCGVGVDNVDHAFAATRGIPVANVPDYGTEDVADTAIGMMLALTRGIHALNSALRAGQGPWTYTPFAPLRRLRGQTLGIVGLGRIGTACALRAKAFGMDVAFHDPFKPDGYDKAVGIRRVESLEDLLRQSYVLTLHCPLTLQTHHLINPATLALFQPGSYLINTSRGQVADIDSLLPALQSGTLAGVAIDVLPHEPPTGHEPLLLAWRDNNNPLRHRIIINPHSAFYSEEGMMDMRVKGAQACLRALTGQEVRNRVN
jgi:D-3-phosphoglycerate dehydrogenase/C-terminal binding protein